MGCDAEATRRLFDWYREHPELVRLLLWEALGTPGEAQGEAAALARRRASVMEAARVLAESHRLG